MSKTPRTKVLGVLPWDGHAVMDTPCGREGSEGAKGSQGSEGGVGAFKIIEGASLYKTITTALRAMEKRPPLVAGATTFPPQAVGQSNR